MFVEMGVGGRGRFLLAAVFFDLCLGNICVKNIKIKLEKNLSYRQQHMQSPNHYPKPLATIMLEPGITRHFVVYM